MTAGTASIPDNAEDPPGRQPFRAALSAFVGTMIEWYDFYAYGTAAALVFGDVFFKTDDPYVGILASLGTFAVGFLARPFGGLLFGHVGDRIGRKRALIATLLIMGSATFLIGILPGYDAIGILAPIALILLRLVQGVAVGGEWGGAVLMATEHAPAKWKTVLASAPQYGSPVGLILASLVFRAVSDLPREQFLSWGWRIPFLLSALLIVVAFMIRSSVKESPELAARLASSQREDEPPARVILGTHKVTLTLAMGLCLLGVAGFYFLTTLMTTFATTSLGIDKSVMLEITSWIGVVEILVFPLSSYCATRIGERRLLVLTSAAALLFAVPMMMLIVSGSIENLYIAILIGIVFVAAHYAVMAPFLTRAYPVHVRYTGVALSFSLSGAVFSGLTPVVGVWLVKTFGVQWLPLSLLFIAIAGISLVSCIFMKIEE